MGTLRRLRDAAHDAGEEQEDQRASGAERKNTSAAAIHGKSAKRCMTSMSQ